jgi:hypothetical protein
VGKTLILLPQPISMRDKNSVYFTFWLQLKHILPMQFWDRLQLEQCHFGFSDNRRPKRDDGVKQGCTTQIPWWAGIYMV